MKVFNWSDCTFVTTRLPFTDYVIFERKKAQPDVVILSHNAFEPVDLAAEIDGASRVVRRVVQLSLDSRTLVLCGLVTSINGLKHISVATANKGRLLDIADRTKNPRGDHLGEADKIKIYNTQFGMIGMLIDSDVTDPELWRKTSPMSDIIVSVGIHSDEEAARGKELAETFRTPLILVSEEFEEFVDIEGSAIAD